MSAKIASFFRSEPRPVTPATPANNVLHIERIRQRHFFNAIERAVLRSDLTRNNIERVMHNAREIWRKHLDGVPGYSVQRDCEQFALDYLDLRVKSTSATTTSLRRIGRAGTYKEPEDESAPLLENLTFAGLYCMIDPPAEDVFQAIQEAKEAGIKVVMITGDHPATANYIANELKIASVAETPLTGKEMQPYEQLSNSDKNLWANTSVFARVTPAQKLDLVAVLQEKGNIVGMTGDGVNDAPALKKADIGIAMGQRGTQVAQEVADMVLKDDAFSSIVHAIKQGRIIFKNIQEFVIYLDGLQ